MISIGLAPLTSAFKKLEARKPWERKGGGFQPSIWTPGKLVAEQVSSAYVPARRTTNGTTHADRGQAEPARTIAPSRISPTVLGHLYSSANTSRSPR